MKIGFYFNDNGVCKLPDGTFCAVEGDEVINLTKTDYLINPEVAALCVLQVKSTMVSYLPIMMGLPNAALVTMAFILFSLVRSTVIDAGIDFQGVLYIAGPQGVGKTSLARRIAGFVFRCDDTQVRPALFFDSSSTLSAIRDAMANNRDLPIIVDDLCMSASQSTERKRLELAAQIVREAANAAEIVKKAPGGREVHLRCLASVLLTAEFTLDNLSDLTRCIIAPVLEPLKLSDDFDANFISSLARTFLEYFLKNAENLLVELCNDIASQESIPALEECDQERVRTNLLTLRWAFKIMLHALDLTSDQYDRLLAHFDNALHESVSMLNDQIRRLKADVAEGNIAYILLCGYRNNCFKLLKNQSKLEKIYKKDGVIFEGDLCLRSASLESFVRRQNGYQKYNLGKIVNELLDYGALCIQEEGTKQVKLTKKKGVPRVYRIKISVLEEKSELY